MSYGITMPEEDHCVYVKRFEDNFVIYVDDILLARNSMEYIMTIKKWLSFKFDMKGMGEATYILGAKIHKDSLMKLIYMSQEPYIRKILERFDMKTSKSKDTHIAKWKYLSFDMCLKTLEENKIITKVPYASAIGSLMYAMMCIHHIFVLLWGW